MAVFQCIHIYFSPLTTVVSKVFVFFSCSALFIFSFCSFTDFQSFYNILKNCRGHLGERSVFSDRTEESSAVQYFQVRGTHTHTHSCVAPVTEVTVSEDPDEPDEHSRVNILLSVVSDRLLFPFFFPSVLSFMATSPSNRTWCRTMFGQGPTNGLFSKTTLTSRTRWFTCEY